MGLMQERIARVAPAAVVVAAVFALAIGDGGRHIETMVWAQSAVLLVLAIAIASGAARGLKPGAPLLIMIGAVALTALRSVWPDSSAHELVMWVTYTAIAMAAAAGLRDSREWFLDGVVFTAGALCLVALYWFWGSGDITARWSSTFYWPNPFAAFLLLVVPMTLVRALRAPTARLALSHGAATVLFVVALVFTYSRGAWARACSRPSRDPRSCCARPLAASLAARRRDRGRRSSPRGGARPRRALGHDWRGRGARGVALDAGDASAHGHHLLERRAPDLPRPSHRGHGAEYVRRHLRVVPARG
jgi:hypothetical protein